jgi:hypothetical protein
MTIRSIRIEGGLLGPDILDQLLTGELPGQQPADFGLGARRNLTDEIAATFADARALWGVFQNRLQRVPDHELATSETREFWIIPFLKLLGYSLQLNRRAYKIDNLTFAISHQAGETEDAPPVHIVGARQELGRLPPSGRPRLSPHALVQEYLNRTEHLWGIVTNGLVLRLLRDSTFVRRQAYVEFDLAAIFDQQLFHDFAALYRLLHRTRLPGGTADAKECPLEQYYQHSIEQGGRVRDRLRDGVERCLKSLANGFLQHPANNELRRRISSACTGNDRITPKELYRQLLLLVYRFLFLLVSEDRGLLSSDPVYREHYSIGRLRRLVDQRSAYTEHDDLWHSLRVLWLVLVKDEPQPALNNQTLASALGLPVLNGQLFEPLVPLDDCSISNRDLLEAFWDLVYYQESPSAPPRRINYAALDVEELGSVYESLLDYHPVIEASQITDDLRFDLIFGSERKSTGSYYTPPELVTELIRSALEPVIAERLGAASTPHQKEQAILSIRVLDPACGSGHFLLAAARRLGKELARIRTGEHEPAPERVRDAIRDVVAHCLYGVDRNPLAVELCRVALWLESHTEGKPLTFLDHRIRCGDSLVGLVQLDVLNDGIPDEAFEPVARDDKQVARRTKRRNADERRGQLHLPFDAPSLPPQAETVFRFLSLTPDDTPAQIRAKKQALEQWTHQTERQRMACDLWTAAFFQPFQTPGSSGQGDAASSPPFITTHALRHYLQTGTGPAQVLGLAKTLAARHRFFHWPLEFPDVMSNGGFDVILCNPPWERVKLQEQEFFAARDAQIADASNKAARRQLIARLAKHNPELWQEYCHALHDADALSKFLRRSGRFRLTARGDINTYSVFAELFVELLNPHGRAGFVVPTGIATDVTNQYFLRHLVDHGQLASLYDFENRKGIFPAVHRSYKFSLLTLAGAAGSAAPEFAFFCHQAADLKDPERRFTLTADDFRLLNPNTGTAPIFRTRRDAELTKHIYRRVPVLIDESKGQASNPWDVEFHRMLDMANDSHLFRTPEELEAEGFALQGNVFVKITGGSPSAIRYLPLYEAKMIHQFNHRFGDYRDHPPRSKNTQLPDVSPQRLADPDYQVLPRYWVPEEEVEARLAPKGWDRGWLLGWRRIANATNERTVIAAVIPRVGVGDSYFLMLPKHLLSAPLLVVVMDSFAFDFVARQKVAGVNLNFFIFEQLPVLPPSVFDEPCPWLPGQTLEDWIRPRVLELTYTAWDLRPFARDLGYAGPPFTWDEERRFQLRCELDAAFFILYLGTPEQWQREATPELKVLFPTPRHAVDYILDQFPIVRRKDEKRYGVYRTKETILHYYDIFSECVGLPTL